MENQEINQAINSTIETKKEELIITSEIKGFLLETVKWGKFLAITGYIGIGLMLIFSLLLIFGMGMFGNLYPNETGIMIGGLYFIFCLGYLFPIHYLYKFSTEVKEGLQSTNQPTILSGFENLKSLFKFMGIMTAVLLSLYAVIFLFTFIGFFAASLMG